MSTLLCYLTKKGERVFCLLRNIRTKIWYLVLYSHKYISANAKKHSKLQEISEWSENLTGPSISSSNRQKRGFKKDKVLILITAGTRS